MVAAHAVEHGVMVRVLPFIEVIAPSPPLRITAADRDEAIDRFAAALKGAPPALTRPGMSCFHARRSASTTAV